MEKKRYDVNQRFLVVFAVNTRTASYENFRLSIIQNVTLGLHDTIEKAPHNELSDGEVAMALDKALERSFGDGVTCKLISIISWYAI